MSLVSMAPQLRLKLWLRVHRWTSLVCTLFLLSACITGLPLIFKDELQPAERIPESTAAGSASYSLDELAAEQRRDPVRPFIQFVFWSDEHPHTVGFGLARTEDAGLEDVERVLVEEHTTSRVVGARENDGWLGVVHDLHADLTLGTSGTIILAISALCFVVSTLTGFVIYAPYMRRLDFGAIRAHSPKLAWLDVHNLTGIATTVWALVVGATGLMNTLEGSLFTAWQQDRLNVLTDTREAAPDSLARAPLEAAVAAAARAFPGMRVTSLGLAGTRYGTPRHHLIWLHGTSTLTKRLFAIALVDAADGVVVRAEALPWYLRLLEVSRPLHFGDYGGLPMKWLWAGFDVTTIVVTLTGAYLWWLRTRSHARLRVPAGATAREAAT